MKKVQISIKKLFTLAFGDDTNVKIDIITGCIDNMEDGEPKVTITGTTPGIIKGEILPVAPVEHVEKTKEDIWTNIPES